MSTVNISLPKEQVSLIDKFVKTYGYANRSEFIRSVVRLLKHKPQILEDAAVFPFEPPKERSVKKIIQSMKKTGKYSIAFLKSLEIGLKESDYFTS